MGLLAVGDRSGARLHPECIPRGDNHYSRRLPQLVKRGSKHPNAKYTDSEISLLKELIGQGCKYSEIRKRLNVSRKYVSKVKTGLVRNHI
jgi:DNA-binding NarL/FixJ family response regulator